jgi:hypothetical protein
LTDDLRERDPLRVDITDPSQVLWWAKRFGVTEAQLRMAVKAVGKSPKIVARRLKLKKYLRENYPGLS